MSPGTGRRKSTRGSRRWRTTRRRSAPRRSTRNGCPTGCWPASANGAWVTPEGTAGGRTGVPASRGSAAIRNGRPALCLTRRSLSAQQNCEISHGRRRFSTRRPAEHTSGTPGRPDDDQAWIEGRARRWDVGIAHRYPSRIILPLNTPAVALVRDLVRHRVRLLGHFVEEVTGEGARLLRSGAELWVRLPTGELNEAELSRGTGRTILDCKERRSDWKRARLQRSSG